MRCAKGLIDDKSAATSSFAIRRKGGYVVMRVMTILV